MPIHGGQLQICLCGHVFQGCATGQKIIDLFRDIGDLELTA